MAHAKILTIFLNWLGPCLLGVSWAADPNSLRGSIIFIVGLCITLMRTGFWAYRAIQNNKLTALKIQRTIQENMLQQIEIEERQLSILERRRNLNTQ